MFENKVTAATATTHTIERERSVLETNKVLKNTYILLSLSLGFSAVMAYVFRFSAPINPWVFLGGFIGLSFLAQMLCRSVWGIAAVFAFTGFVGYAIGPIIGMFLQTAAGTSIVANALGGTAAIFLGLSGYALMTKKDFSFLRGFITAGAIVLMIAVVMSLIFDIGGFSLAISCGFMLFASALILFQTGQIINGGETNYILATITLYASIYNLFISLLHIFMALSGDD
ncbi:Bax inhibitor-1/YccA family protein [Zooshikella sp. RANM57]|uniref:Bax inhibitor-1/YccA family protein n=1 Tax=Zooshikella sp. RANM57 TaxID=3425863 RepID=UPI003D6FEB6B